MRAGSAKNCVLKDAPVPSAGSSARDFPARRPEYFRTKWIDVRTDRIDLRSRVESCPLDMDLSLRRWLNMNKHIENRD